MGYEELRIHAIQDRSKPSFVERFRMFTSKKERDHTYEFMAKNSTPHRLSEVSPVTLTIIAKTDDVQLDLFKEKGGEQ